MDLRNILLLNNRSTVNIFYNNKIITRFWTTYKSMTVKGSDVPIKTTRKAYKKDYDEVWFDERSITNISAPKQIKLKFRVTYDISGDGVYTIHKPSRQDVYFKTNKDGLHYHKTKNHHFTLVQTVSEIESGYSNLKLNNSKLSREMYAKYGHPSQKLFKNLIKSNPIRKFPVTIEDAIISKTIYGPNISALKGNTTQSKPEQVVTEYIMVAK